MGNILDEQTAAKRKDIAYQFHSIQERIAKAAALSGRTMESVTLLAATKTVPPDLINYAISLGLTHIGENRVQELLEKFPALDLAHCQLQMIGRLQTNKVRQICGKVSMIQSVDSLHLAEEIDKQAARIGAVMNILIEINIGKEAAKAGVLPERAGELLQQVALLKHVRISGLMAIPPICQKKEEIRRYFSQMRQLCIDISAKKMDNVFMEHLSMGMSDDYYEAILEGATMVRIGSALFGRRMYQ